MKFFLNINQIVIFENEWHKSSDLNTWALFDFLCFFNNADGHRTLNDGEFKWVNYKYITESLPLCDFYNQKIKKHLDILANFGLIALEKYNSNNIYFKLLPKHRILFEKNYQPPRENFTHPLVKNYQPPRENFTHNNNKESILKNNNNDSPLTPQGENEIENKISKVIDDAIEQITSEEELISFLESQINRFEEMQDYEHSKIYISLLKSKLDEINASRNNKNPSKIDLIPLDIPNTLLNTEKASKIDLKAIRESFEKVRDLYKKVKPSKSDLIFQKAEQEFFRVIRNGEIDCEGMINAAKKQVELWEFKIKDDSKNSQYIPRLENWLDRKAYFEDFDKLLEPYKIKSNQQARGSIDYGDPEAEDGYLGDILKKIKNK